MIDCNHSLGLSSSQTCYVDSSTMSEQLDKMVGVIDNVHP